MELAQPIEAAASLGSYLDDWLAHVAGRVRAKTWQGYERRLPPTGHTDVRRVSGDDPAMRSAAKDLDGTFPDGRWLRS
jgi:hypothetical protein